jgi:hypothetical protein
LVPPFNSTLSSYPKHPKHRKTSHSRHKHSRLSLVAAAALAAGTLSAAAVGAVATSTHIASGVFAGQTLDSMTGLNSPMAGAHPATLTVRQIRSQDVRASDWAAAASDAVTAEGGGGTQAVAHAQDLEARLSAALVPANVAAVRVPSPQVPATQALQALNVALGAFAQGVTVQAPKVQVPAAHGLRPQALATHGNTAQANAAHPAPTRGQATQAHAVRPQAAPAHPAVSHPPAAPSAPAAPPVQPYLIYDSVTPSAIPWGYQVATYADGAYAASPSAVAGRGSVLWIDTNGSDPRANVLDVEPGDATPAGAAQWVSQKLSSQPSSVAIVYTMLSDWQAVKDNVAGLPSWMQSKVRYWIADPTGYNHVVPGSNATQWYWGNSYDITTANPGFESP